MDDTPAVAHADLTKGDLRRMLSGTGGSSRDASVISLHVWIAAHPNVPPEWVDSVVFIPRLAARRLTASMLNIAGLPVPFHYGTDHPIYRALASNPALNPYQLRALWKLRYRGRYPGSMFLDLSKNPNTPADVIEEMTSLITNRVTSPESAWPAQGHLLCHPNLSFRSARMLIPHLTTLSEHPYLGDKAISAMVTLLADETRCEWLTAEERSRLTIAAALLPERRIL